MKSSFTPFTSQNHWLKFLIFASTLAGGLLSEPRHLIYQTCLFALYFLLHLSIFCQLLKALRRLLPFFAGYWLFATLLGADFIEMIEFTLRIVFLAFGTVYLIGTINVSGFLAETTRLRKTRPGHSAIRFMIATALFIKGFQELFQASSIKGKTSLTEVAEVGINILKQNLARAGDIEARTDGLLNGSYLPSSRLNGANLLAIMYICISMLLYAL